MPVRFDESLPRMVKVLATELSVSEISSGVALRDSVGRLAFFIAATVPKAKLDKITSKLREELGAYARTDRLVVAGDEFGVKEILEDPNRAFVLCDGMTIQLVDRRLVGADWIRPPSGPALPPPRFVFASLKGGVGRSTALCVAASHMAARGLRVLAVDLDLEAPGLGPILLDDATVPKFGMLDALIENGMAPLEREFLTDTIGPSSLADRNGQIDVVPALGRASLDNPGDVLAKIARAYADDVSEGGQVSTVRDQIADVVEKLIGAKRYDAVLIDARAGLNETTAAPILGLGAEVLFFGLDDRQTSYGYSSLFAHLSRFIRPGGDMPEWAERMTMVHAKASADTDSRQAFSERFRDLFTSCGLAQDRRGLKSKVAPGALPFNDVPWDETASEDVDLDLTVRDVLPVITILDDDRFRLFEPQLRRDVLSEGIYQSSYGEFIAKVMEGFQVRDANELK